MATTEASQRQVPAHNPDRDPSGRHVGTTRRGLLGSLAAGWALFGLGAGAGVIGMVRILFPNVLFEPPSSFKAGLPADYGMGVDERFKAVSYTHLTLPTSDLV